MNSKVKVNVGALIAAIEARRAEAVAEHAEIVAAHPARLTAWQEECRSLLAQYAEAVEKGERPGRNGYAEFPSPPINPARADVGRYDRDIATLRMAADATITITAEDYGRYVR